MSEEKLKDAEECTFCGKRREEVQHLFAAADSLDERGCRIAICNECVMDIRAMLARKDPPVDDTTTH